MKAVLLVISLVLILESPAGATTWDFSWSSSIFFDGFPGVLEPAEGHATGRNTAIITPVMGGQPILSINFEVGRIDVFDVAAVSGLEAIGVSLPIFRPQRFSPTGEPLTDFGEPGLTALEDFGVGSYEWTGLRDRPESFRVSIFGPGSGPDPRRTFSGTGVRHTEASEPGVAAVVVLALAAAIRARRRRRSS